MSILGTFPKQPNEIRDYDVSFADYLARRDDTPRAVTPVVIETDPGLVVESFVLIEGVVKVFLSGGVDGESYNVKVTLNTTGGRRVEGDIVIRVKEYGR